MSNKRNRNHGVDINALASSLLDETTTLQITSSVKPDPNFNNVQKTTLNNDVTSTKNPSTSAQATKPATQKQQSKNQNTPKDKPSNPSQTSNNDDKKGRNEKKSEKKHENSNQHQTDEAKEQPVEQKPPTTAAVVDTKPVKVPKARFDKKPKPDAVIATTATPTTTTDTNTTTKNEKKTSKKVKDEKEPVMVPVVATAVPVAATVVAATAVPHVDSTTTSQQAVAKPQGKTREKKKSKGGQTDTQSAPPPSSNTQSQTITLATSTVQSSEPVIAQSTKLKQKKQDPKQHPTPMSTNPDTSSPPPAPLSSNEVNKGNKKDKRGKGGDKAHGNDKSTTVPESHHQSPQHPEKNTKSNKCEPEKSTSNPTLSTNQTNKQQTTNTKQNDKNHDKPTKTASKLSSNTAAFIPSGPSQSIPKNDKTNNTNTKSTTNVKDSTKNTSTQVTKPITTQTTTSVTATTTSTLNPAAPPVKLSARAQRKAKELAKLQNSVKARVPISTLYPLVKSPDNTKFSVIVTSKAGRDRFNHEPVLTEENLFPPPGSFLVRPVILSTTLPQNVYTIQIYRAKVKKIVESTEMAAMRSKYFPAELNTLHLRLVALADRIETHLITLRPKLWTSELLKRPKLKNFTTKVDLEILELVNALGLIYTTIIKGATALQSFADGLTALYKQLNTFKDSNSIVYKHLVHYIDEHAISSWPVLLHKTKSNKYIHMVEYSQLHSGEYGTFVPFLQHTVSHFAYIKSKIPLIFATLKIYCKSPKFLQFVQQSDAQLSKQGKTGIISKDLNNNHNSNHVKGKMDGSKTTFGDEDHKDSNYDMVASLDLSKLFTDNDANGKTNNLDIADVDPRYYGYSTPYKLILTGLPSFMTLPQLHRLLQTTPAVTPPSLAGTSDITTNVNENNADGKGGKNNKNKVQYCQYDRCWMKSASNTSSSIVANTGNKTSNTSVSTSGNSGPGTDDKNNNNNNNNNNINNGASSTAFIICSNYANFLTLYTTFHQFEYHCLSPWASSSTTQVLMKFKLTVELPLSSYVPLIPIVDSTDFSFSSNNTSSSSSATNTNNKNVANQRDTQPKTITTIDTTTTPLTPEEELLISQTRWCTTPHFKDFLAHLVTEVKHAQMTHSYSQFSDSNRDKSNHQRGQQLVGSAALVVEMEQTRQIKLKKEQEEMQLQMQQYQKQVDAAKHGKRGKRREIAPINLPEPKHDPLSGLSAAFGYGLGVGRTTDISKMSLPIIDQLLTQTSTSTKPNNGKR